jgi:hypothetical protein
MRILLPAVLGAPPCLSVRSFRMPRQPLDAWVVLASERPCQVTREPRGEVPWPE